MTIARPFRHLCPEADERDALSDAEFWERVYSRICGADMEPEPPDYGPDTDGRGIGVAVISDHISPCPVCHEWGACGYDAEGRPMIHAFYDHLDGEE